MLATVVATPCTAPFMGAALGSALIAPPAVALAIFVALGGGLAAPFVLATAVPAIARRLPRPGPWMVWFKQLLAFPLYGTVAWLIWVLIQEVDPGGAFSALARPGRGRLRGVDLRPHPVCRTGGTPRRRRPRALPGSRLALFLAATLAPAGGATGGGRRSSRAAAGSATRHSARRGSTGSPPSIGRSLST